MWPDNNSDNKGEEDSVSKTPKSGQRINDLEDRVFGWGKINDAGNG